MELIEQLTQSLGIDENQAKGGIGLILNVLKEKLTAGDFGKIAELIPNADAMLQDAPKDEGGLLGKLGGLVSSLRGGEGLGDLAELAGGFKNLGLDGSLLKKFVPIVLDFLKQKGGDSVKTLLDGMA